jgi:aryl-phospho-beta-D-glucosidase BglC (GH1 family)
MGNFIKISDDRWNFEFSKTGKTFVPLGTNYYDPNGGWLPRIWEHFDEDTIRRHFDLIARMGLNIVRFHTSYASFMPTDGKVNKKALDKMHIILEICKEYEVFALITGLNDYEGLPQWDINHYYTSNRVIDNLTSFWSEFCAEFKENTTVFGYDIYNEPTIPLHDPVIEEKYKSARDINTVQPQADDISSDEERKFDYLIFLESLGYRWLKEQVYAIRAVDSNHLVTVGVNPWTCPDLVILDRGYCKTVGFNSHLTAELIDFMSIHYYPIPFYMKEGYDDPISTKDGYRLAADIFEGIVRLYFEDKPIILEEFGWYGGGKPKWDDLINDLPHKSQDEQATYVINLIEESIAYCSGWIHWTFGDTPESSDISEFGGLVTSDLQIKSLGERLKNLASIMSHKRLKREEANATIEIDAKKILVSEKEEKKFWDEYIELKRKAGPVDFRYTPYDLKKYL